MKSVARSGGMRTSGDGAMAIGSAGCQPDSAIKYEAMAEEGECSGEEHSEGQKLTKKQRHNESSGKQHPPEHKDGRIRPVRILFLVF